MTPNEWKTSVVGAARRLGDREYQEQTWFGRGQKISSPEELICEIFDDYLFDEFLAASTVTLTDAQYRAGASLKNALEEYSGIISDAPDPRIVIDDPHWEQVRIAARAFVKAMEG
jgi:hypothetical protein